MMLWRIAATRRRRRRLADEIVRRDFPDPPPEALSRRTEVREAVARSALAEQVGPVFVTFLVLSLLGIAMVALDLFDLGPTRLNDELAHVNGILNSDFALLTDVGIYVIGLVALGILVIGLLLLPLRGNPAHDRGDLGPGHLLAAYRASVRATLLRRAGGAGTGQADHRRWPAGAG